MQAHNNRAAQSKSRKSGKAKAATESAREPWEPKDKQTTGQWLTYLSELADRAAQAGAYPSAVQAAKVALHQLRMDGPGDHEDDGPVMVSFEEATEDDLPDTSPDLAH